MHPADINYFKVNSGNTRTRGVTYAAISSYNPSFSDKSHSFKMSVVKKHSLTKNDNKKKLLCMESLQKDHRPKKCHIRGDYKTIYIKISGKIYRFLFSQTNF